MHILMEENLCKAASAEKWPTEILGSGPMTTGPVGYMTEKQDESILIPRSFSLELLLVGWWSGGVVDLPRAGRARKSERWEKREA